MPRSKVRQNKKKLELKDKLQLLLDVLITSLNVNYMLTSVLRCYK